MELIAAAGRSDILEVRKLLSEGYNINAVDNYGYTPLHNAALNGNIDIVQYLVDKGCDINAVDNYGNTLLHRAAKKNIDIAQYLIN
ncbi:hypothetical protein IE077_003622 [Cardiosporidium cionae]|uniref:Uncharacterized protein n=1 Tax=Cardiosporidium cionae TaxID=476202 RepID=A0ABQ7J438_9APIC|nr:hypothetical protein IE077_003622 [Cardiosporidium cionae]|eukprot:KAF8817845.1 hypothetical protein IE077_003622 [Cardiosporidium cionae]